MSSQSFTTIHLSDEQIDWLVEIISSVVRNNLVQKPPGDWTQIPEWWFDLQNREALGFVPPELLTDVRIASSCLEAFRRQSASQGN